jgi:hypothetical protein
MLTGSYPDFLGGITRPEQHWENQLLIKIVEYFAASFY